MTESAASERGDRPQDDKEAPPASVSKEPPPAEPQEEMSSGDSQEGQVAAETHHLEATAGNGAEPEDGDASQPEGGGPSTIELLDEDDRLEDKTAGGAEPEEGETQQEGGETESDVSGTPEGGDPPSDKEGEDASENSETASATATGDPELSGEELFPSSPIIEQRKEFWIKIFTIYDSYQGVLHDQRMSHPYMEVVHLQGMKYRAQRRLVKKRKRELKERLLELAEALRTEQPLTEAQNQMLADMPDGRTPEEIEALALNLRFQRGLSDRFREGLIKSGALMKIMRDAMAQHGVPEDLIYLPHVESSFNNDTYSRSGARGIWQFTRGTGKLFMRVGHLVDQRLDPVIASRAAAKFLRQNYEKLGSWPLAITAYNHGPIGLQRIIDRLGTRDLTVMIQEYYGRLFRFASKNFYAEFLAAREVAKNYRRYFGELPQDPPLEYETVQVPFYLSAGDAAKALGITRQALQALNPALRRSVWSGSKYIPKGYKLRIPKGEDSSRFLAGIPEDRRHEKQKRTLVVRVRRGDTLYGIGRRYGIPWRRIALANNIDSARRLRYGQRLILPWDGVTPPSPVASREEPPPNPPLPTVVERFPVNESTAENYPSMGGHHSASFQDLQMISYDPGRQRGEIVAAFGESLGLYAEWAGVTARELRQINHMSYRTKLRPGQNLMVSLDAVRPEEFTRRRIAFHRERELSFFAENNITEMMRVEVKQGQSAWKLAQNHNVPMWLFYRENPELLTTPMRAGMQVVLPVVEPGATN